MASVGILSGQTQNYSFNQVNKSKRDSPLKPFSLIPNPNTKRASFASMALSSSSNICEVLKDDRRKEIIFSEKLDEWMEDSVPDIVKNLKQAPLLVHIYAEDCDGNGKAKIKTEKAIVENWPVIRGEWETGDARSPDGLIFVDEIRNEDDKKGLNDAGIEEETDGVTRAWGILVQGKGAECGPTCYLLKTSKVGSGGGLGSFCTHFCLLRVKNFRESFLGQFQDCWLSR